MSNNRPLLLVILALLVAAAAYLFWSTDQLIELPMNELSLTSSAFEDGGLIPSPYTCDGANVSPELSIDGAPEGTRSLTLIMDDPDVPKDLRPSGMFDHWVAFNIPPATTHIAEGTEPAGIAGNNSRGEEGYTGPCPPDREHRYFFKLYALDRELSLSPGSTKEQVEAAMQGAILAETQLMGRYNRPQNR